MERVIQVINRMEADGVIDNYAIGGGIAAVYYLEPYETDDIDVFIPAVAVGQAGLISLEPIYSLPKESGLPFSERGCTDRRLARTICSDLRVHSGRGNLTIAPGNVWED
jgi:hypothetical protein